MNTAIYGGFAEFWCGSHDIHARVGGFRLWPWVYVYVKEISQSIGTFKWEY